MAKGLLRFFTAAVVLGLILGLSGWALAAEPIKIGAFFSRSGDAANIGTPSELVAKMVVDVINKEGGINGRPLNLVVLDTESDPTKALTAAKRLVEVEKVVALIGPDTTAQGMAVKKYIEEKKIPTFMTVGGDPVIMEGMLGGKDLGTAKYIFKSPQRSSTAVQKIYQYLKDKKIKNIALLADSGGFGRDGKVWLTKYPAEFGLSIVADESFSPGDADMTTQLTKIKSTKAEAIICWTISPSGAITAKNVKQLGIKIPLIQCHGLPDPKYIELAKDAADGSIMPSTKLMAADQLSDKDPQKKVVQRFIQLYTQQYKYDKQFPINTHSGYAWDAIYIVANAMKKAGTDDPAKLRDAIENTKGYVGISGVYNLSPQDHNGLGVDSMVMLQIQGGKWKLVQ